MTKIVAEHVVSVWDICCGIFVAVVVLYCTFIKKIITLSTKTDFLCVGVS